MSRSITLNIQVSIGASSVGNGQFTGNTQSPTTSFTDQYKQFQGTQALVINGPGFDAGVRVSAKKQGTKLYFVIHVPNVLGGYEVSVEFKTTDLDGNNIDRTFNYVKEDTRTTTVSNMYSENGGGGDNGNGGGGDNGGDNGNGGGFPTWGWVVIGLGGIFLVLLVIGIIVFAVMRRNKKSKSKSKDD